MLLNIFTNLEEQHIKFILKSISILKILKLLEHIDDLFFKIELKL
jgi:hypothetical protein